MDKKKERQYIAIDLKSFYASVECMERGLDPLTTNLVVADDSRTTKTICLAATPAIKSYGISGRSRLFEVVQKIKEANAGRIIHAPGNKFTGKSCSSIELAASPELEISYIVARPRMALYMSYSTRIYNIYLKYVAPEDIQAYSVDEVFMDVTDYLFAYKMTAHQLAMTIIKDVLAETGITATAGIGTNLYLAKIAMDIVAKHAPADEDGVRIAEIDEMSYRKLLWDHKPITDFWRIGKGYAKKLASRGLYTMGDVARCSIGKKSDFHNEDLLYKLFGVNAELLIDHAWGWEPCTMADIKAYRPQSNSLSSGQVLHEPYPADKTRLIVREMIELLTLDLVDKKLVTDQIILTIGYDIENLTNPAISTKYRGPVTIDGYGRKVPKHAHGTANTDEFTSSTNIISSAVMKLFDEIINPDLLVRRVTLSANHLKDESQLLEEKQAECEEQLNLFTNYEDVRESREKHEEELETERKMQQAILDIKKKFGKNAMIKGMNLEEGGTTIDRNRQIGGHKA